MLNVVECNLPIQTIECSACVSQEDAVSVAVFKMSFSWHGWQPQGHFPGLHRAGTVLSGREWWDTLESRGSAYYGYYTNSAKSILLVKPDKLQEALEKFAETGVEVRACFLRWHLKKELQAG